MKKKITFLLMTLFALVSSVFAQDIKYSVSQDLAARPGTQVNLSVSVNNSVEFKAWQMEIALPEGVSLTNGDDTDLYDMPRNASHTLDVQKTTRGGWQFVCYGKKAFKDNSGIIITIPLTISAEAKLGVFPIRMYNLAFADMDDTDVPNTDIEVNLRVFDLFNVSANSADEKMGSVTIEPSGAEVESGTTITAKATPVAGYEFVNWTAGETVASTDNPYSFELAAATVLTANFKAIKYPVLFKNGEDVVQEDNLDYASEITAPETDPTKTGYTFLGWYNGDTKFEKGATVPVDGVIYTAKWQINQYTITFDTDGGSEIAPITQDYNSDVTKPADPTKTGYTFSAWDQKIPATMPAENITLKAIWTINKYTITFDTDGGSVIAPITQDYNTAVTAPENPTKEGHTFKGWKPALPETVPAENTTVKAQWEVNSYTITFVINGNVEEEVTYGEYGSKLDIPEATKEGYTFNGWKCTSNPEITEVPATIPAQNLIFEAQWTINQYLVTFILGDKTLYSEKQDYGSAITIPETGEMENMHVVWDPEVDETVPAKDVTYTGIWVPNNRTITFKFGNGQEDYSYVLEYGKELTYPEKPVKEGHTFNGWSSDVEDLANSQKDVIFTAQWKVNSYKITFVINGDVEKEEIYAAYGTELDIPEATKEGYTFKGWTINGEIVDVPETIPAKELTFVALWEINQYTITFDTDGGSAVASITQDYASDITAPAAPTKKGYTFIGWTPALPETMPAENMTLKANWQINKYTVTFKIAGKVFQTQTLEYGAKIVAPEPKVLEGRTFEYWNPTVDATVPDHNVVYEAVYSFNKYTITYYVNDVIVNTVVVRYGDIIENYVPTLDDGMTFDGWTDEIPQTMPAHNLEIHGTASNTSTAIKNIMTSIEEGCNVYTDNGVLVKRVNSKAELSTLPTGKYIINGVKIVINK